MPPTPVVVEGLKEFQRELKRIGGDFPKELKTANKRMAERVQRGAQERARGQGGVAARVAPSIRAGGQAAASVVRLGGARYPEAMGAEFGSLRYKQFKPWRGSGGDAGYFLWPEIREQRDDVMKDYGDLIDSLVARAFPR